MNNEFLNSINVVRRRAWLIGLLMVVTVATILYLGYTAPASYQARCLLYTSDAADERSSVDLGGRRIIKKKKNNTTTISSD